YPSGSRRTFLSRISFSRKKRLISETTSSKQIASRSSAASTHSRSQCSRFSPCILPSAVRWQRCRANLPIVRPPHCQRLCSKNQLRNYQRELDEFPHLTPTVELHTIQCIVYYFRSNTFARPRFVAKFFCG